MKKTILLTTLLISFLSADLDYGINAPWNKDLKTRRENFQKEQYEEFKKLSEKQQEERLHDRVYLQIMKKSGSTKPKIDCDSPIDKEACEKSIYEPLEKTFKEI